MYDNVLEDIESVFAANTWTANNIEIYPDNYQGDINSENEFCRLTVLPSNSNHHSYGGSKQLEGLVIVKMFVKAGEGQSRLMAISDILDISLQNKSLSNGTKLGTSYLNVEGLDPSNKSLYSARYIIPFKLYGE